MKRLLLMALLAATARAVDVTGTYENTGTLVSTNLAPPERDVSLRGLLGLEFNLPLARALHSDVDRVELSQAPGSFTIRCFDADGKETWNGRWEQDGYAVEEKQVKLVFRAPQRFGDNGFLFILRPVGDRRMLLIDVYSIKSTSFGPGMKPVGTFIFDRLPDQRVAAR